MTFRLQIFALAFACLGASRAEAQPVDVVQFHAGVAAVSTTLGFSETAVLYGLNYTLDGDRKFTGVEVAGGARLSLLRNAALWVDAGVSRLSKGGGTNRASTIAARPRRGQR